MTYIEIALNRVRCGVSIGIRELPNGAAYWSVKMPDFTRRNFSMAGSALRCYQEAVRRHAPVLGRGSNIDLRKAS